MQDIIAQSLGYIASLLLAISLMVGNDLKFRWLNTFGCLSFILYGIFIGATPVILTNCLLLLINLFYLVKLYKVKETFDLLPFEGTETMAKKFISFYKTDIDNHFPDMNVNITGPAIRFVVLRDLVIANMFVASVDNNGEATVELNYTVEKYRDYKVGRFIFEREKQFLIDSGVHRIVYKTVKHKGHQKFLEKMGFEKAENEKYIKNLQA